MDVFWGSRSIPLSAFLCFCILFLHSVFLQGLYIIYCYPSDVLSYNQSANTTKVLPLTQQHDSSSFVTFRQNYDDCQTPVSCSGVTWYLEGLWKNWVHAASHPKIQFLFDFCKSEKQWRAIKRSCLGLFVQLRRLCNIKIRWNSQRSTPSAN